MRNESEIMDALGRRIGEELGTGPDREKRRSQREAVALLVGRGRPARSRTHLAVAAAAVIAIAVIAGAILMTRDRPMAFWIGADLEPGQVGAWIDVPAGESRLVRFSDGSRIDCSANTLVRVVSSKSDGVGLALDHGRVLANVNEETEARWAIEAGPYTVSVKGTVFSVQWEPDAAELEVDVERGEVRVQGPGLDGKGTALTAGDSLRLGKSEPAEPAPQVQQMPPAPLTPPADDGEEAEEPAQEHKPKAAAPTWKSLAAEGRYKEAMDAAEAEGFDTLLAKLGQADLWELARAARYARKGPKAVAALEAFRQRFPGSTKADTAAFLLGRVEMELNKKPGRAVQWFRAYLKQSPDGPLAEEARGRLIDAHLKSGNEAAAKQAASSYLAKHKEGVFKALAESVLAQ